METLFMMNSLKKLMLFSQKKLLNHDMYIPTNNFNK